MPLNSSSEQPPGLSSKRNSEHGDENGQQNQSIPLTITKTGAYKGKERSTPV